MILLDANVLLYAYDSSSEHHEPARRWLERALSGAERIGLPWTTILAFLRIATHLRLRRPLTVEEASGIVSEWLQHPRVIPLDPGDRHWETLAGLLRDGQARGPLVMDAHMAALAIDHGATLVTTDRDFARFPGVRTQNPLAR